MRILVVNQYFQPDRSATSQLLTELCEDLARSADVQVVAGRPSYNPDLGTGDTYAGDRAIRVKRAWSTTFDRAWMPGRLMNYATYLASSMIQVISAERPDVMLAWTDPPLIGLVAALASRWRRVPLVLTTQDIFPDIAIRLGRIRNRLAIAGLRRAAGLQFRTASRIVCIGRDMHQRLEELGAPPEKVRTISNWADGARILPLQGRSSIRRSWGLEDRFVVMHSGNVGLSQSLDTLVGAAELLQDRPEIAFVIVGEGAAKAGLQADVAERGLSNVMFTPYQTKSSLSESLGAADVHFVGLERGLAGFIVPSKVYGIMAAGRPMIAVVEAGSEPALIVEEHQCGLRVEPGDPAALAKGILALKEDRRDEMGRRARQAFETLYDRPIATAAYRELLEDVAAHHKLSA